MSQRRILISLFAALLLVAAACSGDDRPTFDEAVEDSGSSSTSTGSDGGAAEGGSDDGDTGGADTSDDATPEAVEEALVRQDPPPAPDPALPPQPTAEDALAVYLALALDSPFIGDCANKPDGDTSQNLCYVTDNITWSVGPNEADLWYVLVVTQVEGGWVVTEANSWTLAPPPPAGDPATEEGA